MKIPNWDHTLSSAHKKCTVISWCVSFECVIARNTEKAKFVGSYEIQRIALHGLDFLGLEASFFVVVPLQTSNWMHLIDSTGFCQIQHDGIKSVSILLFTTLDPLEDKSLISHLFFVEIPLHSFPVYPICDETTSERALSATLRCFSIFVTFKVLKSLTIRQYSAQGRLQCKPSGVDFSESFRYWNRRALLDLRCCEVDLAEYTWGRRRRRIYSSIR